MNDNSTSPTIYYEINELLQQLLLKIQSILKEEFAGMYIGGSLATNSFNSESSDIDCYIITKNLLSISVLHKIEEMHKQFYQSNISYSKKIETSYIPLDDLLSFNARSKRPYYNEGKFYLAHYGSNFEIELYILRENGITIAGPNIKNLIKEIQPKNLILAIHKNLDEYWKITVNDLSKISRSDYQVFAILTMCRTLYSFETGRIASKIEAAQWAMSRLETQWKNLVEQALAVKPGEELNKLKETQQFVSYVINKS